MYVANYIFIHYILCVCSTNLCFTRFSTCGQFNCIVLDWGGASLTRWTMIFPVPIYMCCCDWNLVFNLPSSVKMNSLIVQMCYDDVNLKSDKPNEKNFSARCKYCLKKKVSGNITSSTNFLNHIKVCAIIIKYFTYFYCSCNLLLIMIN